MRVHDRRAWILRDQRDAKGYHIRESPFNLVAGSGFLSDHLAQHKEPPTSPQNAGVTIAAQHARELKHLERSNAEERRRASSLDRASVASTDPTASTQPPDPPGTHAARPSLGGGVPFPRAPLRTGFERPMTSPSKSISERAAAEIRAVRQRAVERGLLLGAHPPLNPAAGHALEPSVASSRKASPDIAAAELPPRALWERSARLLRRRRSPRRAFTRRRRRARRAVMEGVGSRFTERLERERVGRDEYSSLKDSLTQRTTHILSHAQP